jgi:drug/metabolite transporter (DMT)-like permease
MWTLFTAALSKGDSTTQVAIINTSSNFVLTALLGLAVFGESLPPLWWVGAAMLVAGNVIVGRKDEGGASGEAATDGEVAPLRGDERRREEEGDDGKDDEDDVREEDG